ncbi:hypothetical protein PAPHI01_2032 [Pancytospora philotis]|nr:hypothetical protein PAPHI01_2032 [Pancytospora philotis]
MHVLFLCDPSKNHNKKVVRIAKSGQLRFGRCFYSKLNCYSTVEDALADERCARLVPRYAAAILREQLPGRLLVAKRGVGMTARERMEKLAGLADHKSFGYRIEARVHAFQLDTAVRRFIGLATPANFIAMPFANFSEVIASSVCAFKAQIVDGPQGSSYWTFGDVFRACLAEVVFVERFLKGGINMHMIGTRALWPCADSALYGHGAFAVPAIAEVVERVHLAVADKAQSVLCKLFDASKMLRPKLRTGLHMLLDMEYAGDVVDRFIDLYYAHGSEYTATGYAAFAAQVLLQREVADKAHFETCIDRASMINAGAVRSDIMHAGFAILCTKHEGSAATAVDALRRRIEARQIGAMYALPGSTDSTKRVALDHSMPFESAYVKALIAAQKLRAVHPAKRCSSEYVEEGAVPATDAKLMHGLCTIARPGDFAHGPLHDGLSYGFFYTRNLNWTKNRRYAFARTFRDGEYFAHVKWSL